MRAEAQRRGDVDSIAAIGKKMFFEKNCG